MSLAIAGCAAKPPQAVWRLDDARLIGGHTAEVLGSPQVRRHEGRNALCFDGRSDGVFVPVNPIAGWPQFTIEVLFQPDGDGPEEQRFLHIQDDQQRRALIETRLTKSNTWALDTFLHATTENRLTLLDRTKVQPTDRWYRVALVYDGRTMSHYVDGVKQLEGAVEFSPTGPGRISLGVRQNKIHWFKGCIAEVRFTASASYPR
jgi:hypothetical protein